MPEYIFAINEALYNEKTGEAVMKPEIKGELIRCKDCKYKVVTDNGEWYELDVVCSYWETDGLTADDYCSYGERGIYKPDEA